MPTPQANAGYDRAGTWHEVLVTRDASGRWQVIDAAGSQVTLIETLTGHDDRLHQAQALARDYADQQRAYQVGERENGPRPRRPESESVEDQSGLRSDGA
jgi:hypothetical protein